MSPQNQQKLMEETVNIILDSDIAKEDVSHESDCLVYQQMDSSIQAASELYQP